MNLLDHNYNYESTAIRRTPLSRVNFLLGSANYARVTGMLTGPTIQSVSLHNHYTTFQFRHFSSKHWRNRSSAHVHWYGTNYNGYLRSIIKVLSTTLSETSLRPMPRTQCHICRHTDCQLHNCNKIKSPSQKLQLLLNYTARLAMRDSSTQADELVHKRSWSSTIIFVMHVTIAL